MRNVIIRQKPVNKKKQKRLSAVKQMGLGVTVILLLYY